MIPTVRALPAVGPRWRLDADVVVVGSGAAGISAALSAAAAGLRVLVVTKELAGGATPLAQGGLAAAIGPGDSAALHVSDTRAATSAGTVTSVTPSRSDRSSASGVIIFM